MMNGCVESEPWVWIVEVTVVQLPRKPSIEEYQRTAIGSPSESLAAAEKASGTCKNEALRRRAQEEHDLGKQELAAGRWDEARLHLHAARTLFEAGGTP